MSPPRKPPTSTSLTTTKLTRDEKKMLIDTLKVRYNTLIKVVQDKIYELTAAHDAAHPFIPIQAHDQHVSLFMAHVPPALRAKTVKALALIREVTDDYHKIREANTRTYEATRGILLATSRSLERQRDQAIMEITLAGTSDAVRKMLEGCAPPTKDVMKALEDAGLAIKEEVTEITGLGYPSPTTLTLPE